MTSSNGNIFRVTGPLCREFTGPGEFPAQRPVTRSFDVFFDLRRLNKRLRKQPWGWWFETLSWSLWRQCNPIYMYPISDTHPLPPSCWISWLQAIVRFLILSRYRLSIKQQWWLNHRIHGKTSFYNSEIHQAKQPVFKYTTGTEPISQNALFARISNSMGSSFLQPNYCLLDRSKILHIPWQHSCRVFYKIL